MRPTFLYFKRVIPAVILLAVAVAGGSDVSAREKASSKSSMKHNTDLLRAGITETTVESDLMRLGLLCVHSQSAGRDLVVNDVLPNTAGASSGIVPGDVIAKVDKRKGVMAVTVNHQGQIFQAKLYTDAFQNQVEGAANQQLGATHEQISVRLKEQNSSTAPLPAGWLRGNIGTLFANLWIARYQDPNNAEIRHQLDVVEKEMERRTKEHGGSWHTVEYYGPDRWQNGKPDPRFLLNGGVRLFGVGDSADAKRLFEETLQCDRNNPDAYFNLGALCEANGQFTAAKHFFLQAKQFGMNLAATRANLSADVALEGIGKRPGEAEGGLYQKVRLQPLQAHPGTIYHHEGTCSLCRIVRGSVLSGN